MQSVRCHRYISRRTPFDGMSSTTASSVELIDTNSNTNAANTRKGKAKQGMASRMSKMFNICCLLRSPILTTSSIVLYCIAFELCGKQVVRTTEEWAKSNLGFYRSGVQMVLMLTALACYSIRSVRFQFHTSRQSVLYYVAREQAAAVVVSLSTNSSAKLPIVQEVCDVKGKGM